MYESNEGSLGQECTIMILLLNILLHYLYLTNFFWMFVEGELDKRNGTLTKTTVSLSENLASG